MELTEYRKHCDLLDASYIKATNVARVLALSQAEKDLGVLVKNLQKESFGIAVVGEFSRGKSTFINALLGKKILPASKNPTTAIISIIAFSDTPKYMISMKKDAKEIEIDEDDFINLKAPKNIDEYSEEWDDVISQKSRIESIDYAKVYYPLDVCKGNIEIIDTPGLNDIDANRVEITYNYLDKADAIIFLLAADQALTATEAFFLQERISKNKFNDIFFIINRKDMLHSEEEERDVIEYVKRNIKNYLPADYVVDDKIFLVSSKQAMLYRRNANGETMGASALQKLPASIEATGFVDFESALLSYLDQDKGREKIDLYYKRGLRILSDIEESVNHSIVISQQSKREIMTSMADLQPKLIKAKNEVDVVLTNLKNNLEEYAPEVNNKFKLYYGRVLDAANEAIDSYVGELKAKEIQRCIVDSTYTKQKDVIEKVSKLEHEIINNEVRLAKKQLDRILKEVDISIDQAFKISASNKISMFSLAGFELISNRSEEETGWGVRLIAGAIGASLGGAALFPMVAIGAFGAWLCGVFDDEKAMFKQQVRQKIVMQYESMSTLLSKDLRKDYLRRAEAVLEDLRKNSSGRIEDIERNINNILQEKEAKKENIVDEIKLYNEQRDIIIDLKATINRALV